MIAIVETNKLHIDGIYDDYTIDLYSVDSTLCGIVFDGDQPPHTVQTMTEEEYNELKTTPEWNHDLVQDGN